MGLRGSDINDPRIRWALCQAGHVNKDHIRTQSGPRPPCHPARPVPERTEPACTTDGAVVENHTYDSADRLTDTGFTYDAFGRTTKTGTGATNTYWANDKVAAQEKETPSRNGPLTRPTA